METVVKTSVLALQSAPNDPSYTSLVAPNAEEADAILTGCVPGNGELLIYDPRHAIDPDLRSEPGFDARRKLALAEVLALVADSLETDAAVDLGQQKMLERRRRLQAAIQTGVGQMLRALRPREELAHKLLLWKANSRHAGAAALPNHQMTLMLGPNVLTKKPFLKVVEHELAQYNGKIANGLYRTFVLLPLDQLKGGKTALIPYLRMASTLRFHILGSVAIQEGLDELSRLRGAWRFRLNDVPDTDRDILSNASIVANHVVMRAPRLDYGEETPLVCGLEFALAAQMSRYFQRKKDGHWYIPLLHPDRTGAQLRTVNIRANRTQDLHDAVYGRTNLAYSVSEVEDRNEAGVKIYGVVTAFPEDQISAKELGTRAIPMLHSQARVTKNRIEFFILTQLERHFGGSINEKGVEAIITAYLNDMKLQGQIDGFSQPKCRKDSNGRFFVSTGIRWMAGAQEFLIDLDQADEAQEAQSN